MEIEVKYSVSDVDFSVLEQDAEIQSHAALWNIRHMCSEYFDNDLGELMQKRYTLRFRREGENSVCCVKYNGSNGPDGLKSREELEFSAGSIEDGIAVLLKKDIPEDFKEALRRPVTVKTRFEFDRRTCILTFDGFSCEMAMDEGIFGKNTPFREVEFELKSGDPDAMLNFCKKIAERYSFTPQYESKLSRALKA